MHYIVAALAIILSYTGNSIYIYDILKGKTKPHLFTWLTWSLIMGLAATIAFSKGAMASSLVIGNGSLMCLLISGLSLKYGEKQITRADRIMFFSALAILPVWVLTQNALIAAVLATIIDVCGYGPTFRKSWGKPQEENLKTFSISVLNSFLSVMAVSPYSLTTGLYPTMIFVMNVSLVAMLIVRRYQTKGDFNGL